MILICVVFVLMKFLPELHAYLLQSDGFSIGQVFGFIMAAGRAVSSKSARLELAQDFFHFIKPHLTQAGIARVSELSTEEGVHSH